MASVMAMLILYSSWDSWNPANITCDRAHSLVESDHTVSTSWEELTVTMPDKPAKVSSILQL